MLYRGPSSRLETLIEKIQQNKDSSPGRQTFWAIESVCLFVWNPDLLINNRKIIRKKRESSEMLDGNIFIQSHNAEFWIEMQTEKWINRQFPTKWNTA